MRPFPRRRAGKAVEPNEGRMVIAITIPRGSVKWPQNVLETHAVGSNTGVWI